MIDRERYERVDLPFYEESVSPILPQKVLDFHAHAWRREHGDPTGRTNEPGGKYVILTDEYPVERLLADGRRIFPDKEFRVVAFGSPSLGSDFEGCNAYLSGIHRRRGVYPFMLAGRGQVPRSTIAMEMDAGNFLGYKAIIPWVGNDYGDVKVDDMLGEDEMALADEMGLPVLLHVPRSDRLADREVQRGVRELTRQSPNARIVLAHCGRCYLPDEMKRAIGAIADLENVVLDTAMVMDPLVLQIAFERIGPRRVVFGTDLPFAAMRGRRVYVMDHWVDVVLEGYPPSGFRVASDEIRASFMAYEIVLAVQHAGEMAGLSSREIARVFWDNGVGLLERVKAGEQMRRVESRWGSGPDCR